MNSQRPYEQILGDAVRVLTEAARHTSTWTDPDGQQRNQQADWAEFVTLALAGAAANLGSIEQALAGRPGSWEADHVRQLLVATVGEDERYLSEHRTEPLTITVAVDNLLTDLGYWQLYEQAEAELQRREDAIGVPRASGVPDTAEFEAAWAQLPEPTREQEGAQDEIDRLRERLERLREQDWANYGEMFTRYAVAAAKVRFPNLAMPVQVEVHLDWRSEDSGDPPCGPAYEIWERARELTPLPGSGIPPKDYPGDIAQHERAAGRDPLTRLTSDQDLGQPDRDGGDRA